MPDEFKISKPSWINNLFNLNPILNRLDEIKSSIFLMNFDLPTKANKAIAVRLSDGEKFYKAMGGVMSAIGNSFPFATESKESKAALVDEDGTLHVKDTQFSFQGYMVNRVDEQTLGYRYTCMETYDGKWCIKKTNYSTTKLSIITYATVLNNPQITTYSQAISSLASLQYDNFSVAF
jgi:hypothetical protein